jgi:carboxymethylenebutenolidase
VNGVLTKAGDGGVAIDAAVLHTENGRPFDGVFARGADKGGPAVLVLTEMFGVSEAMRIVAQQFAECGVPALVPNLFWRADVTRALDYEGEDRATAWSRLAAFDKSLGIADLTYAKEWMGRVLGAARPLVLVGYCGGGLWSYLAAATGQFAAGVSFYALGIAKHLDQMPRIACPVQLHYGLSDQHVPHEEIDAVSAAAASNSNVTIFTYEGAGHSFANPKRPMYDPDATKLALIRIDELFARLRA